MKIEVREREQRGTAANRRLRRDGFVPGIIYGHGVKPRAFVVPEAELRRALSGGHGTHAILDVLVEGDKTAHPAILKDYQRNPARGDLLHVDLQVVRLDQTIQSSVAVVIVGDADAPGIRAGGVVIASARELNVEALPTEVPDQIEADISGLEIGDSIHLSDLEAPKGVTFLDEPETLVVSVAPPARVVEEVEEVEEEEGVEGEEAAEGGAEAAGEGEASSE